jgi:hypothetical protein
MAMSGCGYRRWLRIWNRVAVGKFAVFPVDACGEDGDVNLSSTVGAVLKI